jgi:hypothetical protein
MGNKIAYYTEKLRSLKDWDSYLQEESGLPGPRGNLELAQAFADLGDEEKIQKYLLIKQEEAPVNSAKMFLTFCGVVGLGTLINKGKSIFEELADRFGFPLENQRGSRVERFRGSATKT